MTTTTTKIHWAKRAMIGAAATATLAASSLAMTSAADAAPITEADSVGLACRSLRSEANALVDEYAGASEARRAQILARLDQIGRQWNAATCRARYGDVTETAPAPDPEPCVNILTCSPPDLPPIIVDIPDTSDTPDTPGDPGDGTDEEAPVLEEVVEDEPDEEETADEGAAVVEVTTSYTAAEHARLLAAAEFWGIPADEFQKFGVQALRFIHGLSGTTGTDPLRPRPEVTGPVSYTSEWAPDEAAALDWVSDHYDLSDSETQKLGASVLIFFAALAR